MAMIESGAGNSFKRTGNALPEMSLGKLADYLRGVGGAAQAVDPLAKAMMAAYALRNPSALDAGGEDPQWLQQAEAQRVADLEDADRWVRQTPEGAKKWFTEDIPAMAKMAGGAVGTLTDSPAQRIQAGRRAGELTGEMLGRLSDVVKEEGVGESAGGAWKGLKGVAREELDERGFAALLGPEDMFGPGGKLLGALGAAASGKKLAKAAKAAPKFSKVKDAPKNTTTAYKLLRKKKDGSYYPLFVDADTKMSAGEWLRAVAGETGKGGKVKSKLGLLANRPGWHSSTTPTASHIGGVSTQGARKPDYRPASQVWVEVEVGNDVDWQSNVNELARKSRAGEIVPRTAQLTEEVPYGGHYSYRTNTNQENAWVISGEMRILDELEQGRAVQHGDLPSLPEVIAQKNLSFDDLTASAKKELQDHYPEVHQKMTTGEGPESGLLAELGRVVGEADPAAPIRIDLKDFKHPTKGPNQRSITEVNLRELSQDEAIEAATRGVHLKRDKTGQYIGAPRGVNTPAKLNALRESYDRQLEEAALGADWYNRARQGNIEVTGDPTAPSILQPNITKGDLVSDVWGLTSAQRTPEVNLGVATKMINQAAVGKPELTGTMPVINKKVEDTLLGGQRQTEDLQKLGVFGTNINPNVPYATTGVNDIWHARAWGYREADGSIFNSGLSPAQHAFLDGETMLAVARANGRQINGKIDWDASTAQAAPWVEGKAHGLIETKANQIIKGYERRGAKPPSLEEAKRIIIEDRGFDIDAARAEAAKTYTDYFDKHTAFANYEAIPGQKTGHLPAIRDAGDDIKEQYTEALTSVDPQGRDLFYDALGIQTRSTEPTQGFYRNEAGQIEANPGRVARPLVGIDPTAPTGRAMDQPSVDIIEGVETLRAVMLGQEGIGYHKPFPRSGGAKGAATGSLRAMLPSRPTPDQLGELNRVLTSDEFADLPYQSAADILVDTGDGITMINLGDDFGPAVVKAGDQKKMVDRLGPHLDRIFGKVGAFEPAYAHGSLVSGLSDIKSAGQGTSVQAVKDALTKRDAPRLIEIFDSPQVQQEAGRIIDVYESFGQQLGTPLRDDLINWLKMIRDGRGKESLDLIGKIALPAGAGVILTQLFTSGTSNES